MHQDALDIFLGYHRGPRSLTLQVHPQSRVTFSRDDIVDKCVSSMIKIQKAKELELAKNGWLTAYLLLIHRFLFPKHLSKWWEWVMMVVWMYFWSIWMFCWQYARKKAAWRIDTTWVRDPRSGRNGWFGDEQMLDSGGATYGKGQK